MGALCCTARRTAMGKTTITNIRSGQYSAIYSLLSNLIPSIYGQYVIYLNIFDMGNILPCPPGRYVDTSDKMNKIFAGVEAALA